MIRKKRRSNRRIARATQPVDREVDPEPGATRLGKILLNGLLVIMAVGIVVGFTFGGRALARWLRYSESFALASIEISGAERLTEPEILAQAGLEPGMSMFEVDELESVERLQEHPWIREAEVAKRMPQGIQIRVTERELAAMVWAGSLWRVDVDGTIFEKHEDGASIDHVLITGVDEAWLSGDREQLRRELCKIIQIIGEYQRMGLGTVAPVKNVHREHGGGIVLYVGDEAREVRLGSGHTRKKLVRLRAVLRKLRREDLSWDYIMVDSKNFPERVVVKLTAS